MLTDNDLIHAAWLEMARQLKLEEGKLSKSEDLRNYPAIYDLNSGQYAAVKVDDAPCPPEPPAPVVPAQPV